MPTIVLRRSLLAFGLLSSTVLVATACGDSGVSDTESARLAYVGIDPSIDKLIDLGFKGFNDAQSANIPMESTTGDVSGMLSVTGMVDQGASNNKNMNLNATYAGYSDGAVTKDKTDPIDDVVYDTSSPLAVGFSMKGLPNANLTGTISGSLAMKGGLTGAVTLNLTVAGQTEDDGTGKIRRKAGTIHVTGTATSDYGTFTVDVTY